MKKNYIYMLLGLLLATVNTYGQQILNNRINIPTQLYQEGDSLFMMYDIDVSNLDIGSERALTLTPVLVSPDQEVMFPPVLINGKKRNKAFERGRAISNGVGFDSSYNVLVAGNENRSRMHYHEVIPYEQWMDNASLYMLVDLCGCGGYKDESYRELLVQSVTLQPRPVPAIEILPVAEVVQRDEEFSIVLEFPVSRTVLLNDFSNNREKFNELDNRLREILNNDRARITRMDIRGYASPEGRESFNVQLSEGRANELRTYLIDKFTINGNDYNLYFGGEDWDMLARLVRESNMLEKDAIPSIITQESSAAARKESLKSLNGGEPYRKMLRELYPQIRRVEFHVFYTIE